MYPDELAWKCVIPGKWKTHLIRKSEENKTLCRTSSRWTVVRNNVTK